MKALKTIGIVVALILFLLGVAIAVLPSKAHVERSIIVQARPAIVFNQINNLKKFNTWSPWTEIDPNTDYVYEGPATGVGAKVSWESDHKDVGSGSQRIIENMPNQLVKTEILFGGFENIAEATFMIEPEGTNTKVTWSFDSEFKPPWNLFGAMIVGQLGPYYEKGLNNLKQLVESLPPYSIKISEEETQPVYYLGIKSEVKLQDPMQIQQQMASSYGALMTYIDARGKEKAGMPICLYHDVTEDNVVMEPAIPMVELLVVEDDRIEAGELPALKVVKGIHYGDYVNLSKSHEEIIAYMKDKNLNMAGHIWEQYVNDPELEQDTMKWETHIYYAIN